MNSNTDTSYTAVYAYDNRGNILSKRRYAYTEEALAEGAVPAEETTFAYKADGWVDQLVQVDDKALTYDANGNVLTYGDRTFTWERGRILKEIEEGENTYSYSYDDEGIRTAKTVNGVTTSYITEGGVILSQSDGSNTMLFQYDSNSNLSGFTYNGTQYHYITNQMGDVCGITDAEGNLLATYRYDEWGNLLAIETAGEGNAQQLALAEANPFRYRSYYYDAESGYYYLQSRYYDAAICRFINADMPEFAGVTECASSVNLFAYCENNPVNMTDSQGKLAHVASAVLGAVISALTDLVAQALTYWVTHNFSFRKFKIKTSSIIWSAIQGLVTGALVVSKLKKTGVLVVSIIIGLVDGLVTAIMEKKTFGKAIWDTVISVGVNIAAALIGGAGIGSKFFQKNIFTKGGVYHYGKYFSSRKLLLSVPSVRREFAQSFVKYCRGALISLLGKIVGYVV